MAVSYRREVYEDRSARISILAGRKPPGPDTLKQTDQPSISATHLQTGRAIRFLNASTIRSSWAGCRGLALMCEKPSFLRSFPT